MQIRELLPDRSAFVPGGFRGIPVAAPPEAAHKAPPLLLGGAGCNSVSFIF